MIRDINPLHISCISFKRFRREGKHTLYYRLARRKGWVYFLLAHLLHDTIYNFILPAEVLICGQNNVLRRIKCKSNQEAQELCEQLNLELEDFIQSLRKPHETE